MSRPKNHSNILIIKKLAERVGFEPTLPFRVNTLSKRAPSATRPSLPLLLRTQEAFLGSDCRCFWVDGQRRLDNFLVGILWPAAQNRKVGGQSGCVSWKSIQLDTKEHPGPAKASGQHWLWKKVGNR